MNKRFLSALMALIMLFSLVPAAALTASAASYTTSDAAISMLKDFEGYSKYCKWDNAQWSVGYGTACDGANHPSTKVNGDLGGHAITEVEAIAALREELEVVEKAVNNFAASNGLNLGQSKFDALVLFSYNCGTAWMGGSGIFKQAVVKGTTGNDFLYAISLWSNSGGYPSTGLLNRRMAEANLYLNGVYSATKPSNYTYVQYNGNGGSVSDKMQGYDSSSTVAIKATATYTGKTFVGWYTAPEGGEWIRRLSADVGGTVLYAVWQDNENPTYSPVDYTMSVSSFTSLQPLSKPSADGTAFGDKLTVAAVKIVEDYVDANGDHWCRISGGGWLKVGAQVIQEATSSDVVVTVTNTYINVRKDASAASAKVGTVNYGDKLTITAVKTAANGALWGQFEDGWVALMYTDYASVVEKPEEEEEEAEDETVSEDAVATAVVSCSTYVNVRKGAGVTNATCGTLANGTKVTIYEIVTVNGHEWGRISTGWFCLDYAVVTLVETEEDTDKDETEDETGKDEETEDENAEKAIATGTVVCSTYVNVRSGAGVGNTLVGKLANGTAVEIFEIKTVIGHEWGRVDAGSWVCLDYVNYTLVETESGDNTGSEDKEEDSEQITTSGLFSGTVTSDTLNIRKRADVSGTKLGAYVKGEKVSVIEVVSGVKADGTTPAVWGKVEAVIDGETVEGWICLTGNVALDPVNYTVISNTLNVREGAGTAYAKVDKLSKGTVVAISNLAYAGENLWGYSSLFGGWMNITSTYMERTSGSTGGNSGNGSTSGNGGSTGSTGSTGTGSTSAIVGTAIVTGGVKLNVRSGAGLGYGTVGQLASGTEITVYESVLSGGMTWGRIDQGWICLSYVMFTSTGVTGAGEMATVVNTYTGVNVRSSASTNAALMGKILVNSRVEILEQKTVNGKNWGRVNLGWVSMDYILLDSSVDVDMDAILGGNAGGTTGGNTTTGGDTTTGTGSNNTTTEPTALASYKGTAVEATAVYKTAGSDVTVGVELAAGEAITVYELVTVTDSNKNETYWARVDEGWILASNVALEDIEQTYTVICNKLNIRQNAGASSKDIGDLFVGDVIEVTKLQIVKASIWGYIDEEDGWVNTSASYLTLGKVSVDTSTDNNTSTDNSTSTGNTGNTNTNTGNTSGATGEVLYTGTVVRTGNTKLALRQTPSTSGAELGRLADGTSVKIYEVAVAEYMAWGKTDSGWICLTYVDLLPTNEEAVDVRVVWREGLNIRSGAGATNELVGTYAKCTVVEIYEFSGNWGRTADGWVCLDYLLP